MKHLLLIGLFVSQLAVAECDVRSASTLTHERQIGKVTNLVKDTKVYGQCSVKFQLTVDGTQHNLTSTLKGYEQEDYLCYYAVEKAKTELLMQLGGAFQTEAVTVCKEGNELPSKVKIGDTILESEVGKSKINKYFTHNNTRCRMFTERMSVNRELRVYHGVICQIDKSDTNWLVVDKW